MILSTMNDVPGNRVTEVLGEVFGLTVRTRHAGSLLGAAAKSVVGGELKGMTKALVESRHEAQRRLVDEATERGADAVLAVRFDASEVGGGWQEICAYGTAVRLAEVPSQGADRPAVSGSAGRGAG
jgi:uncharacterized protein YbjQ (UPF0145 family)